MRLIDAELLLKRIAESREKNPHEDSKTRANHTIEHDHIAQLVLEQPTAYDVDKVVERLMCESINCHIMTDRAVEIVKSGGIQHPDSSSTATEKVTADWKEHLEDRFNRFE